MRGRTGQFAGRAHWRADKYQDAASLARGPWPDWPCRLLACGKAGKGTAKPPVRTRVIVFAQMYSIAEKGKRRNAVGPKARRRIKVFAVRPQDVLAFFQKAATLKPAQPGRKSRSLVIPARRAVNKGPYPGAETSAFWLQSAAFSVMMDLHGIPCGSLPENGRRLVFSRKTDLPVYIAPAGSLVEGRVTL